MTQEKKIRVVFCLNDFLVGGAQRQLCEQLRFYDRARFDISIVTLFDFGEKQTLYGNLPIDVPVYKLACRGWWDVPGWAALYHVLRAIYPDIVVSSFFFANTMCRVLKPFLNYASIAREHNTHIDRPLMHRLVNRTLSRLSYKIVAVSTTVADFTAREEGIPRERFVVIHNGIDASQVERKLGELPEKHVLRQKYGLAPNDLVCLNVARLTPQKNHELLVEGFAAFSTQNSSYKLVVVGDGALKPDLEKRTSSLGVKKNILFVGHQTDTWAFYKMADIFVSTSDIEGLSNSYLKALAAGLPLIATKTAGTDELIEEGKNGFFVHKATPESVEESLEKYMRADRDALGVTAKASVKHFDLDKAVKRYEKLFLESAM